jgi:hypothetical protein
MPTRIIREGILTSERVDKLSERAELFYRRLMSVADDYGRYFANPANLRVNCYPVAESTSRCWISANRPERSQNSQNPLKMNCLA